jgi:hypothetical protein
LPALDKPRGKLIAIEETTPYDVVCADGIGDEVLKTRHVFQRVG